VSSISNPLRRGLAAYLMELRLLCLHWSYALLHILWAGLLWVAFKGSPDLGAARESLMVVYGPLGIGLSSLVALFVAAAAASRGQRSRFAPLDGYLPTGFEVPLGRYLAALTGLMGAMIEPIVLACLRGPVGEGLAAAPFFLLQALATVGFSAATAWYLVHRLGMRRWVYPILAATWLLCALGNELTKKATPGVQHPVLNLLNVMRLNTPAYRELWGLYLEGSRPLWFNLFYLGLALCLLGLVAWQVRRERMRQSPLRPAVATFLAGALALGSGAGYIRELQSWSQRGDAERSRRSAFLTGTADQSAPPERIERYEITADLTSPATPAFTAQLKVRNSGQTSLSTLRLTLRDGLAITASSLPVKRQGDFITIDLPSELKPGATTVLSLTYSGQIFVTAERYNGEPTLVYFAGAAGVRLGDAALWYPLAGHQLPALEQAPTITEPFQVDLTIKSPEGWNAITNLPLAADGHFRSAKASWLILFASPTLALETHGSILLAGARNDLPSGRTASAEVQELMGYMERYIPGAKADGLTLFLFDGETGVVNGSPPDGAHLVLMPQRSSLERAKLQRNEYWTIGQSVLNDYLQQVGAPTDSPIDFNFLFYGLTQVGGNPAKLGAPSGQGDVWMNLFGDLYRQYGDEGIRRVFAKWIKHPQEVQGMEPRSAEIIQWVKEAAKGAS
jgi:hypothetical protein